MRLRNNAARILYLNLPSGLLQLPPLGSVELFGEAAQAASAVLAGAFRPFVDDGSLEVESGEAGGVGALAAGEPSLPPSEQSEVTDEERPLKPMRKVRG